jgi:hypothetical protein
VGPNALRHRLLARRAPAPRPPTSPVDARQWHACRQLLTSRRTVQGSRAPP